MSVVRPASRRYARSTPGRDARPGAADPPLGRVNLTPEGGQHRRLLIAPNHAMPARTDLARSAGQTRR